MTLATFDAALQELSTGTYIALFELDTSPLFMVPGIQQPGGVVYRRTSGIIDLRTQGALPAVSQTATVVTLDRYLPLTAGRTFQLAVQTNPDTKPTPVAIASLGSAPIPGAGEGDPVTGVAQERLVRRDLPEDAGFPLFAGVSADAAQIGNETNDPFGHVGIEVVADHLRRCCRRRRGE